jgi:putative solute:sodium symporter small subunit
VRSEQRGLAWRRTIGAGAVVLVLWLAVSLGAGLLLADRLDAIRLGGFPLGFWFATQGSILSFLGLVVWHVRTMNGPDRGRHPPG